MYALESVKVLDLSRLAPGVYCTMILGDLGANIIKVEEYGPLTGRRAEQAGGTISGRSTTPGYGSVPGLVDAHSPYNAFNRNKMSMALNLKKEEGRQVFCKLAARSDVLVDEFRPGVTRRLGIDYETLSKINPRLVYCSITGYGQDGPQRDLVGHDINYISQGGALGFFGPSHGPPAVPSNLLADYATGGMNAVIGILAALIAREKSGRGQFVDIAMVDGVVSLMGYHLSLYYETGKLLERGSHLSTGSFACYSVYETKDAKFISIGSVEPWFYANLCRALGREDLIPYQYDLARQEEIRAAFSDIFKTRTRDEWFEVLTRVDVCAGKVYSLDELETDPQIRQRKMITSAADSGKREIKQVGIPIKLSGTPGGIRYLAPSFGEQTEQLLAELGYHAEAIAQLRAAAVIP